MFGRARRLCLDLPETSETVSWGHPTFRVGRKTFCAFEMVRGRPSIAFRLHSHPPAKVQKAMQEGHDRGRFFPTPYGRGLWVSVWVDGPVDWKLVGTLVDQGFRAVATKRLIAALDLQSAP